MRVMLVLLTLLLGVMKTRSKKGRMLLRRAGAPGSPEPSRAVVLTQNIPN